jgi:curved DNA-binding protein CbpA
MNYYEVLEIDPSASTEEIERAFKRLARKVHPDLNSGAPTKSEARMKQLNEIRDTLTDPLLRAGYDEGLRRERARSHPTPPPAQAAAPAGQPAPPAPHHSDFPSTPSRFSPSGAPARSRAPWLLLVMGASATSALLWHWRRDLPWGAPAVPVAAQPAAPAGTARPAPPAKPAAEGARPARVKPRARGLVRLGSSVDEVFQAFGTPDRIQPGQRNGDAVFVYGGLRLQITNGRVTGGDAAALH